MARTGTKENQDPSDKIVRVRGGLTGVRLITLSDWKKEVAERKQRKIAHIEKSARYKERVERKENRRKANEDSRHNTV